MKQSVSKFKNIYLLSFFIPVLLMLGIFVERGIFPFGKNSFMFSDMYHQYVPFLTEFWHKLHGGEGLSYSWQAGLGANFVAIYAYYLASPINWLAFFCPEAYLIEFMTYFIVVKIGLCGLTFAFYLSRHFETKDLRIVWFSVFYAMSGFLAAYSWNHMWMDILWLAPLVILGLEELVIKKKYRLYCLTLTASIFTNYYLSILLCIFLVLYFFLQLFTNGLSCKRKLTALLHFTLASLLAGGMAGVLLFPVMNAMHATEFHDISFPKKIDVYFNALEMLARHVPMLPTERGLEHWPNIYCGVLVFVLIPIWIFHKRIPLKQKIGKLLLLTFFLLGFSVNILNFLWHGLNYPNSLPARQSFLYIFVILTMCFEAVYRNKENGKWNRIAGGVTGLLLLMACGIFVTTDGLTVQVMASAWIFLAGYFLLGGLFCRSRKLRGMQELGKWAVLLLVCVEALLNMEHTSVKAVQRPYYLKHKAAYTELTDLVQKEDTDFFRIENVSQMTKNDSVLAGYQSASIFSSTSNGSIKDLYKKLGMGGSKVAYYYEGATPFSSALLGVRYLLSEQGDMDATLYERMGQSGDFYLYRCKQTLPVGFFLKENGKAEWEEVIDSPMSNPLILQNSLAKQLDCGTLFSVLTGADALMQGNVVTVKVPESGHLYGVVTGKPEGKVIFSQNGETKELKDVSSDRVLDLGWFEAGEHFTITAEEEEELFIRPYRLSVEVLEDVVRKLGENQFTVKAWTNNSIRGTIVTEKAGNLILSVPAEEGWKLFVDGQETAYETFGGALVAVPLLAGSHTIRIQYAVRGIGAGIVCTAVSLILFILLYGRKGKKKMLGNVIVGQSGGPTAVINASVAGVYTAAKSAGAEKVYGMVNGIQGFLEDRILNLDEYLTDENNVELLKRTPSAFLGSCRFKLPVGQESEEIYEQIFARMEQYDITSLFYIGGNDSMDTVKKLSDYAAAHGKPQSFIGVPKTIDNDLPMTDHCPGYGSAAKYIATSLKEIIRDNAAYGDYRTAILIVEIMGRHAGWLTAAAALAKDDSCEGVDAIYLPERDFDQDAFLRKVWELAQEKKSVVIAVSEGIHLANGRFVCELDGMENERTDVFGHKQLSGCGVYLAELIQEKLGYKARAVEFSTLQRAASHMASLTDIEEAAMAGRAAVEAAAKGKTGVMVTFVRAEEEKYSVTTGIHDIHGIANLERKVQAEWIREDGCGVTEAYVDYARPLILGELYPIYENGTPKHLVRK